MAAACVVGLSPCAFAQSQSAFTYQGRLKLAGVPVTNTCDFKVSLWNAQNGGTQLAGPLDLLNIAVDKGLFVISPDFGFDLWDGADRFLQIAVRSPAGSGSYVTLAPRQQVMATPYALAARSGGGWVLDNGYSAFLEAGLGVGTASPSARLHLVQAADAPSQGLWVSNSTLSRSLELWVDGSSNGRLQVGAAADTPMLLNGDGNGPVGIGTLDPAGKLDVRQTSQTNTPALRVGYDGPNAGSGASSASLVRVSTTSEFRPLFLVETALADPAFFIGPSGNVGLGTVLPTKRLDVAGDLKISGDGYKPANPNTWIVTSDARIKDEVRPVEGALDLLAAVRPVTFRYTESWAKSHHLPNERREFGVLAQEFAVAFPEFVSEGPYELPDGSGRALMVDSSHLAILAVAAVKELDAENTELKRTIQQQTDRIGRLERELAEIRRLLQSR